MLKDKIGELRKRYDLVKNKSKKVLSYRELQERVKLKEELKKTMQLIKNILLALDEAEEYARTYGQARTRLKKELNNLEVINETL